VESVTKYDKSNIFQVIASTGEFAKAFSEWLRTTTELQKLKVECDKYLAQLDFEKDRIEAVRQFELAKIDERKHALEGTLNYSLNAMEVANANVNDYLRIYEGLARSLKDPSLPAEQLKVISKAMNHLTGFITQATVDRKSQLETLHESTRILIQSIPSAHNLLPGTE
jgi:hypothetical protein